MSILYSNLNFLTIFAEFLLLALLNWYQSSFWGLLVGKKVNALEERLERKVGQIKSGMEEWFLSMEGIFSFIENWFENLEKMMNRLVELQ